MTIFAVFITAVFLFSVWYTESFLLSLIYGLTGFYVLWGFYHLAVAIKGGQHPPFEPPYEALVENRLPKISLIIPARNEPILSRTIEACLNHTQYPLDKKEIIAVVDDPEGERIAFWYQQKYPENVKVLARRNLYPTKPSALNDTIHLCTGEIVGILDVEDIPDRDVFLKAAYAIGHEGKLAAQAILRISNPQDSWISKIFSMEYAGWFRVLLNGRSRLGHYSPLGGTGNYFKKSALDHVGLYDPTNLAEDAELSIRLLIAGWNVGVLNARHWEEAPVNLNAWIKQRTRWFRGWLQSLWKYLPILANPKTMRRLGLSGVFSTLMMLIGPIVVVTSLIAYGITALWLVEMSGLIAPVFPVNSIPMWTIIPITFNILYYYIWIKGAKLEGIPVQTLKLLPYMFIYMNIMMPIAALRALYQEVFKEISWEKTSHDGRGVVWRTLGA
jgi:glycosyltransferase XagB